MSITKYLRKILTSLFIKHSTDFEKRLIQSEAGMGKTSMPDYPFVTVIMPNWNGRNDTVECIYSLADLNYPKDKMELVIADNGSHDGSVEAIMDVFSNIRTKYKWEHLKLIENGKNIGAPAAYNRAIAGSDHNFDYLWKIDNDIVVDPNSLVELVKVAELDKQIGIIGSKMLYHDYDGSHDTIWFWAGMVLPVMGGIGINFGKQEKDSDIFKGVRESGYVAGASCLIRKDEAINTFCEDYFVYFDDTDLCLQSKKRGYKCVVASKSKIWHKVSASTGAKSAFYVYYRTRNQFILAKRNLSIIQCTAFLLINSIKYILIFLITPHRRSYLRGVYHGLVFMFAK